MNRSAFLTEPCRNSCHFLFALETIVSPRWPQRPPASQVRSAESFCQLPHISSDTDTDRQVGKASRHEHGLHTPLQAARPCGRHSSMLPTELRHDHRKWRCGLSVPALSMRARTRDATSADVLEIPALHPTAERQTLTLYLTKVSRDALLSSSYMCFSTWTRTWRLRLVLLPKQAACWCCLVVSCCATWLICSS